MATFQRDLSDFKCGVHFVDEIIRLTVKICAFSDQLCFPTIRERVPVSWHTSLLFHSHLNRNYTQLQLLQTWLVSCFRYRRTQDAWAWGGGLSPEIIRLGVATRCLRMQTWCKRWVSEVGGSRMMMPGTTTELGVSGGGAVQPGVR